MLPFAILFKLRNLRDVPPWGPPGAKQLHWFGLTDGCYCIETSVGALFDNAGAARNDLGVTWFDYYVSRIFEDFIEIWPTVRDPIPLDIIEWLSEWYTKYRHGKRVTRNSLPSITDLFYKHHMHRVDDAQDPLFDVIVNASCWCDHRRLDTSYLRSMTALHLWRVGTELHLDWKSKRPWLARAQVTMSFEAADKAVKDFCRDFLQVMRDRVSEIARDGWRGQECDLDIQGLVSEQAKREASAAAALSASRPTEWELVRASLHKLSSLPG